MAKDEIGNTITHATPGPRYVQVAQGFGQNGVLGSICDADYSRPVASMVDRIGSALAEDASP